MLACPTRSRVEPGWTEGLQDLHGIGRSGDSCGRSGALPLFHVVAVATLAAVAAALGCSCGFTLGIPVTVAGSQWEKEKRT